MGKTITAGFISDTINGIGINSSIKCNNDNLNNNTSRSVAYVVMHYTGNSRIRQRQMQIISAVRGVMLPLIFCR